MKADSIKVQGYSCFKENLAGFDVIKPITVIIGRNNSGKSHLIELVQLLVEARKPPGTGDFCHRAGKMVRQWHAEQPSECEIRKFPRFDLKAYRHA